MSSFDREAFFARSGAPTESIEAEGRTWHLRPMRASHRLAIADWLAERELAAKRAREEGRDPPATLPSHNATFYAKCVAASLCTEDGTFVLGGGDEHVALLLDTFEQSTIEAVGKRALHVNKMLREETSPNAEPEATSGTDTNGGSPSA